MLGWALAATFTCAAFLIMPARAAALGPLLRPNLVADPPVAAGEPEPTTIKSWEGRSHELLRFNGYIRNQGPGRLEVRGGRSSSSEPMHVYQRLYREGAKEVHGTQPEDEYEEVARPEAELVYDTDDGHDHFHLQEVAHYSLWNLGQTEEVAPSQKVGFCLTDSEHVESQGPKEAFYHDEEERRFCEHGHPEALSVWEGISVGWRDLYEWSVALQWVDVSNVAPGEYWLREDVDPLGLLLEKGTPGEAAKHAYSTEKVTVRGYDALGQLVVDENDEAKTLTLSSAAFKGKHATGEVCRVSGEPKYVITQSPSHGTLGEVHGNHVTYTPERGYEGADSFAFYAKNTACEYPWEPVEATVLLSVSAPAITTTTTTATTTSTAPPATTKTTTTTTAATSTSTTTNSSGGHSGSSSNAPRRGLHDLKGVVRGGVLIVSARADSAGLVRLSAWVHDHRLGRCSRRAHAGETVTCHMALAGHVSTREEVVLWAMLSTAKQIFHNHVPLVRKRAKHAHALKARAESSVAPRRGLLPSGPLAPVL